MKILESFSLPMFFQNKHLALISVELLALELWFQVHLKQNQKDMLIVRYISKAFDYKMHNIMLIC